MGKRLDIIIDSFETFKDGLDNAHEIWLKALANYRRGAIQEFFRGKLHYTSWILIGIAMLLISSISHYIGFQTLESEFLILLLLIGVRFTAKYGL